MRQLAQIDKFGNFLDGSGKVPTPVIPVKVPEAPKPVEIVPLVTKCVIETEPTEEPKGTFLPNGLFVPNYLSQDQKDQLLYMEKLRVSGVGVERMLIRAKRLFRSDAR